jgi:Ni/Co efflux regulator RcnB
MKSKAIVSLLTIAALGVGSAAQAQQWQPAHGPHAHGGQAPAAHQRQWQGHQAQPAQRWQGQRQQHTQAQRWQGQHWQAQRSWAPAYHAYNNYSPRYYGASRHGYYGSRYYAGGYVPYAYRARHYWVNDWQAYNLAPPPYGYTWVETDTGDFLLMALATGLIASAILAQ